MVGLNGKVKRLSNHLIPVWTPQFFVHHAGDPCYLTTYTGAKSITDKYKLPLVTVTGGGDFSGNACNAFTEHGFRGKEKEAMAAIGRIIKTGTASQLDIN